MKRTDADKAKIIEQLTAAAKPASDGTLYIRACVACQIIGVGRGVHSTWIRDGHIKPRRFRVKPCRQAMNGRVAAWPLGQVIAAAKAYRPASQRQWSEREDDLLCEKLGRAPVRSIAEQLGRSYTAVQLRMIALGVTRRNCQGRLTVGEAATLCRRSSTAIRHWINAGLKHTRLPDGPRERLIDPKDLAVFVKARANIWDRLPESARRTIKRMGEDAPTARADQSAPRMRVYRRCA